MEPRSPAWQADSLPAEPQGKPRNIGVGSLSLLQQRSHQQRPFATWLWDPGGHFALASGSESSDTAAAIEDAAWDLDFVLSPAAPLGRSSRQGGRQATLKRSCRYMKVGDAFLQQPRSKEFPGTLWGPARQLGSGPSPTAGLCQAPRWRQAGMLTFADEALDVEVLVLHPQHLAPAHVPAGVTQDRRAGRLLRGAGSSLRL